MELLIVLVLPVAVAVASLLWSADSRKPSDRSFLQPGRRPFG